MDSLFWSRPRYKRVIVISWDTLVISWSCPNIFGTIAFLLISSLFQYIFMVSNTSRKRVNFYTWWDIFCGFTQEAWCQCLRRHITTKVHTWNSMKTPGITTSESREVQIRKNGASASRTFDVEPQPLINTSNVKIMRTW